MGLGNHHSRGRREYIKEIVVLVVALYSEKELASRERERVLSWEEHLRVKWQVRVSYLFPEILNRLSFSSMSEWDTEFTICQIS